MPAPRIPIVDLPEQTTIVETDFLVVQNGATTKKMEVGLLSGLGGSSVPPGGTTGQVLTKASAADQDAAWAAVPADGTKVTNVQGVSGIWSGTLAAYNAIPTKSPTTLYVIV